MSEQVGVEDSTFVSSFSNEVGEADRPQTVGQQIDGLIEYIDSNTDQTQGILNRFEAICPTNYDLDETELVTQDPLWKEVYSLHLYGSNGQVDVESIKVNLKEIRRVFSGD